MEFLAGLKRTHRCEEIGADHIGQEVILNGWVQKRRDLGGVIFVDLRDRSGIVQLVFNHETLKESFEKAESIRSEYVIAVVGKVVKRAVESINKNIKTGEIEVIPSELRILSKSEVLPFPIEDNSNVNESLRLKHRYLDLRTKDLKEKMYIRHKILQITRNYFTENEFWEIETPILTKSTPEGARDYLVPSRIFDGKFFALPQSPQIFKQLLMVGGMDRYFQIARCFRDEDLRADRQPEFTQVDVEMSFVEINDIIETSEKYLTKLFKEILGFEIKTPFPRLSYKDAMETYGSDKPDTRFELKLIDLSDNFKNTEFKVFQDALKNGGSVRAINGKGLGDKLSRKEIDSLCEFVKIYKAKGLAWAVVKDDEIKSPVTKFMSEDELKGMLSAVSAESGDIILIVADSDDYTVCNSLGQLRLEIARNFEMIDNSKFNFLWVTEFPQFEYDDEAKRYVAMHHPFTMPMDEDIHLLESDPGKVRAKAYDVVLNGYELGGGSIRIYNSDLQERMFNAIGFTNEEAWERFGFLLEAFKYGTPPHGGIAFGLDRISMLLTGTQNIKDVIAFPKIQNSSCIMTNAPDVVEAKQLKELNIALDYKNTDLLSLKK